MNHINHLYATFNKVLFFLFLLYLYILHLLNSILYTILIINVGFLFLMTYLYFLELVLLYFIKTLVFKALKMFKNWSLDKRGQRISLESLVTMWHHREAKERKIWASRLRKWSSLDRNGKSWERSSPHRTRSAETGPSGCTMMGEKIQTQGLARDWGPGTEAKVTEKGRPRNYLHRSWSWVTEMARHSKERINDPWEVNTYILPHSDFQWNWFTLFHECCYYPDSLNFSAIV